jgi:hypothetical protein
MSQTPANGVGGESPVLGSPTKLLLRSSPTSLSESRGVGTSGTGLSDGGAGAVDRTNGDPLHLLAGGLSGLDTFYRFTLFSVLVSEGGGSSAFVASSLDFSSCE